MNWLKTVLAVCLSLVTTGSFAQMTQDKSQWKFDTKKKAGDQYEVVVHLKLEKGWHVYSMKPGGDGTLIPVSITFDKNAAVRLNGSVKEKGKLISEKVEGIKGAVNMYKGDVEYTQLITAKSGTVITGKYEYQMCNDMMCLPPTEKTFKVVLK